MIDTDRIHTEWHCGYSYMHHFSSTSDLQVHIVFTSFVKFGIYWQKNKEDRLVYSFLVKIEHYYECQMFLRATCKRNKLNLLNSTWNMVKVDHWSSLHWSSIPPIPSLKSTVQEVLWLYMYTLSRTMWSLCPPPPPPPDIPCGARVGHLRNKYDKKCSQHNSYFVMVAHRRR